VTTDPPRTTLITDATSPPGCALVELPRPQPRSGPHRPPLTLFGRVATDEDDGHRGEAASLARAHTVTGHCGAEVRVVRYPTTGLNLPGEDSPVGVLVWCVRHGEITGHLLTGPILDTATERERGWGWHTPSQV
jgi:hypothetical protein